MNRWIWVAACYGAVGVVLGAFGAHALETRLDADALDSWSTAVQYQLLHAAVLLALGFHALRSGRAVTLPAALFRLGILLFSGSIYLLVFSQQPWLGPLTPLGGLCLIGGWLTIPTVARS